MENKGRVLLLMRGEGSKVNEQRPYTVSSKEAVRIHSQRVVLEYGLLLLPSGWKILNWDAGTASRILATSLNN